MRSINQLTVCLYFLLISGCVALVDYDKSNKPVAAEIIGKCFVTKKTVAIFEPASPLSRGYDITTFPISRAYRDRASFPFQRNTRMREMVGKLEAGASFTVIKVISIAHGETGRCWGVEGKFHKGILSDEVIHIPSCRYYPSDHPIWINEGKVLTFKKDFASPCSE